MEWCTGIWRPCFIKSKIARFVAFLVICKGFLVVFLQVEAAYVAEKFATKDIKRTEMRDDSVMGKSTCCLMMGSNCRQITRRIASGVVLDSGDALSSPNSSAPLQVIGLHDSVVLENSTG